MTVHKVFPPTFDSDVERLVFTVDVDGVPFKFHLYWDDTKWRGYVAIPDVGVREIGIIPGVVNWSRYLDYSVVFYSEYESIDQSNIGLSVIYIISK